MKSYCVCNNYHVLSMKVCTYHMLEYVCSQISGFPHFLLVSSRRHQLLTKVHIYQIGKALERKWKKPAQRQVFLLMEQQHSTRLMKIEPTLILDPRVLKQYRDEMVNGYQKTLWY